MPPTGDSPSRASYRIGLSLGRYEEETGLGRTYPDNTGFIMDPMQRKVFSPDVAFHTGPASKGVNMRFVEGAPVFAVEIRSENDYGSAAEQKMAAKRADYFAAGTQVVWDVDLQSESVVRSYQAWTIPITRQYTAEATRPTLSPHYRAGRCPWTTFQII